MKQTRKLLSFVLSFVLPFASGLVKMPTEASDNIISNKYISDDIFISAEDVSGRDEFEKHYLLSDGSFVAVTYAEAVHYQNENGEWLEVDNTLIEDRASSRITNSYDDFKVSFAKNTLASNLISLTKGNKTISWSLGKGNGEISNKNHAIYASYNAEIQTIESDKAKLDTVIGNKISDADALVSTKLFGKISYAELFTDNPEISVDYSVFHNKIEEDIYINAPTDLKTFSLTVNTGGLSAFVNDDGSVDFVNENGDAEFHIGIPYMEDASNEVLNDIKVSVMQDEDTCYVMYTPNEDWLTSAERSYPIILDPSITTNEYNSNITDTYVCQGNTENHSSEQKLYFGIKSGKIHRSYIKINNLPKIDASMPIISATMQLTLTSGTSTGKNAQIYKAASSWNPATITYANQPSVISSNFLATCAFNSSSSYHTFNLSSDVTNLYDEFNAAMNYGYIIKYEDESLTDPDYNAVYSTEYTTASSRPLVTVNYGYALPSSLSSGTVYAFRNCGSYSYMTVHNGEDANKTNVYQQSVSSFSDLTSKQKFKLEYVPSTGGYYLRAMCSSNGTARVLDVVKSDGYVNNGGNVQIFKATDQIAQHWFIIGTGSTSFKIVPRTNMSLALTAYPSNANGTSSGTSSTSQGNIYVATYDDSNNYQKWMIIDESGNYKSSSSNSVANATYYFNNSYYGKYLHKYDSTHANAASGYISTLGNTIRWKVTHVKDGRYTIQSSDDLTKYLYGYSSSNGAALTAAPSSGVITDNYLWTLTAATGGGMLVKNVASGKYLYESSSTSISTTPTLGTTGSDEYKKRVWRIASTSFYGNTSSNSRRELQNGFSIESLIMDIGASKSLVIKKYPTNAIWADAGDFSYSLLSGTSGCVTLDSQTGKVTGNKIGIAKYIATHKVTGITYTFTVYVDRYTYELVNFFKFDSEASLLIRDLYNRIDDVYSSEWEEYKAWVASRVLSEFSYDGPVIRFGFLPIEQWDDVAGSVTSPENRKAFFVNTLGYTATEYDKINSALSTQHNDTQTSDFTHMQYSLAARLAYRLDLDDDWSNIGTFSDNKHVSYLAGWLGDATIIHNGTTSFGNDDYMADLDAENLYHRIIEGENSINALNEYYRILVAGSINRTEFFKSHLSYSTVESAVLAELNKKLSEVKTLYPDTYDFLMSLKNGLSEIAHY